MLQAQHGTLDEIIEQQRQIQGQEVIDLIKLAGETEDYFTLDELEEYAYKIRKKRGLDNP